MQIKMSETLGYPSVGGQNAFIASVSTELSEIKQRIGIVSDRLNSYKFKWQNHGDVAAI